MVSPHLGELINTLALAQTDFFINLSWNMCEPGYGWWACKMLEMCVWDILQCMAASTVSQRGESLLSLSHAGVTLSQGCSFTVWSLQPAKPAKDPADLPLSPQKCRLKWSTFH